MKKLKKHKDWVKTQFTAPYKSPSYRNVLIHTGLIENIIEKEAKHKVNFDVAIKILKFSKRYKNLDKIDNLRKLRNKIVHKIEERELDEDRIIKIRDDMHKSLKEIYHSQSLIQKYFLKKYGIYTQNF
jgi:Mn-containing catalase